MYRIKYIWQLFLNWFKWPQDINPFYDNLYKLHNSGEFCIQPTLEEHLMFTLLKLSIYTTTWTLVKDEQLDELRRLSILIYRGNTYKFNNRYYKPKLTHNEVLQCINCIDSGRFHHEIRKSVARRLTLYT